MKNQHTSTNKIWRYHDKKGVKWDASTRQIMEFEWTESFVGFLDFLWQLIWMWRILLNEWCLQCSDYCCWKSIASLLELLVKNTHKSKLPPPKIAFSWGVLISFTTGFTHETSLHHWIYSPKKIKTNSSPTFRIEFAMIWPVLHA
jgi:hypothetical protein